MATEKESQHSSSSMNSDLDHSKVEHYFHEFYTEVSDVPKIIEDIVLMINTLNNLFILIVMYQNQVN